MKPCPRWPTVSSVVVLFALLAGGTGACTRAKAKTVPDIPTLEVPPPPPRDAEPAESEPPPPLSLPQEPARSAPPRPRPATPTREQPQAPKPEPPKPEPPVGETVPPPNEEPPRPPATLQTTPPTAEADVERTIRAMLTRASNDLNRIDYRILNTEARTQYDTAKTFIRLADSAIRAKNLVYAKSLAEKAATIAAQLGGK